MVAYLDSSVLLQHILKGDVGIHQVFSCPLVITSELTEIECRRVIHRYRLEGELNDKGFLIAMDRLLDVLKGLSLLKLSDAVKKKAGEAFPITVKTLDALHLASVYNYRNVKKEEQVLVFSYDRNFNRCAKALGFQVPFL